MDTKRVKQIIRAVVRDDGHTPAMAGEVLLRDLQEDRYVAMILSECLASNTPQRQRAEAICRLLGTYGVGTVVEGRLV
jgi:hypothetical protein